jgi:hypothetical protein|tara:strand:- start:4127 stop:6319 length:2193 start_codon:yes stop_codon:yes gene_type:complete
MSNEFQHKSVGSQMTQTEYEHTDGTGHIFDSQSAGDILFASSSTVLSKLAIGTAGKVLAVNSGASAPEYVAALTGVTSVLNTALVVGRDADNDIDFATDNTILFRADGADQIKLTNGALLPVTDDDIDLGSSSLQFKDGYFDGTLEADAITVGGTAVLTGGAETAITSILNTSLVVGRDADNDIDFGTDNNIIFRAGAQDQVKLIDGALAPVTDNDVDLGTSSLEFKDAYFDGTVTTDALAMATNTSGNLLIGNGSAFASTAVGDLSEISTVANDDVFLAVDTSGGGLKKIARSAIVAGLATSGAISNVVEDTSPQLGGDLDVQTNSIITDTSNRNIKLAAHGTGLVEVRGNTNPGSIILNCESNSHGQTIKAQAHSEAVTNTLTLPAGASSTLVSLVSTDTLTNKTLTTPKIAEIDSLSSGNIVLDAEANIELNADGGTITFKDASASLGTITSSGYSGTAAVATTVTITDNESTDEDNAIIFTAGGDVDGGNIGLESDGTLTYNPSTGKVTATGFVGTLTGNVTGNVSGTAATVTGAAQSNITSLGTLTTLTVDNVITNGTTIGHTDDTDLMTLADGSLTLAGDLKLADGKHINLTTPLLAGSDHTATGTTAQMLAGAAITAFQLVCIHSTTQEVVPADASAAATSRAIGIALADISDTATGTILLHGFVRDDTFNFTTGGVVFLSETTGALTQTAPTTSDAFVQAVGVALEPDVVFINPSVDVIQHA